MTFGALAAAITARPPAAPPAPPAFSGIHVRDMDTIVSDIVSDYENGTGEHGALAVPTVYACVRLIATSIDQLSLRTSAGDAPAWLQDPRSAGGFFDASALMQHCVTSMAIHGAAYILATPNGETATTWRLDALRNTQVTAQVTTRGRVELAYTVDGEPMPIVPRNRPTRFDGRAYRYTDSGRNYLLPVPFLVAPSAPWGLSPVQANRLTITGMMDVERQASTLLQAGNYLGGRLETDLDIDPDTARRIRQQWVAERKTGQIPIIGAGVKYVTDTLSPADAQWLESRSYSAQQIAALYGVPNSFLGVSLMGGQSSLSYSNAQENLAAFRRNSLSAFTKQLENALSTLLPNGTSARFDWREWEEPGYDSATPDDSEPTDSV